jgi:hypothetical protein
MARRRRPEPPELRLVEAAAPEVPVEPRDRVDPRAALAAPEEFATNPERLLAWAELNAPDLVYREPRAELAARNRAAVEALRALPVEERRRILRERRATRS